MLTAQQQQENAYLLRMILSRPDPPDLAGLRRYRYTYPGRPRDQRQVIKMELERAYWTWYMQEAGRNDDGIVSLRRHKAC